VKYILSAFITFLIFGSGYVVSAWILFKVATRPPSFLARVSLQLLRIASIIIIVLVLAQSLNQIYSYSSSFRFLNTTNNSIPLLALFALSAFASSIFAGYVTSVQTEWSIASRTFLIVIILISLISVLAILGLTYTLHHTSWW
jgi:hypothetical protein